MKILIFENAIAAIALLSCAGCSDPVTRAIEEYEIVAETPLQDSAAKCEAARNVKDAALAAQDRKAYELWSMRESNHCLYARRGW